jgi:hypothetical protein
VDLWIDGSALQGRRSFVAAKDIAVKKYNVGLSVEARERLNVSIRISNIPHDSRRRHASC